MALTRIKTNQITDSAVTTAKIADANVTGAKLANNLTYGSSLTVSGNLTVSGTTTSVSTTNTRIEDAVIALSAEASGSGSVDSGLLINRGSDDNYAFLWDETADEFIIANVGSEDGDTAGNISISGYANLRANIVNAATLQIGGSGITATAAELNLIDGGATPGTTAVAAGHGIVVNQGGTMAQTTVATFDTFLSGTTSTLTNKTLTAPKIVDGGFIADANGNEAIIFQTVGSAVNQIDVFNAAASGHPKIATTGDDTNINLIIDPKGSGALDVNTSQIINVTDPTANQHAATKAYVDTNISSARSLTIAADSGSDDVVTVGTNTLTFAGTSNEVETTVSDNQIQIGLPDNVTIGGALTISGNLTVNGTTTTVSTTNSRVSDTIIELNTGAGSNANDLGFIFERGSTGDNAAFLWDESADVFVTGTTTATGDATGNVSFTAAGLNTGALGVTGDVTATGSFIIGSASMNEADLEKIDGITAGTAVANKALVVDTNLDIGTIRNITSNGNIDISSGSGTFTSNVSDTQLLFSNSGVIAGDAAMTFDGTDVTFTGASNVNSLTVATNKATITAAGIITTVEDIRLAADNKQLEIGAGTDFTIGHDGTDTAITNATGALTINSAGGVVFNENSANVDFRIEGNGVANLFVVDGSQDNVGIGGAPNANAILDLGSATSALILPKGTTAQRPTGVIGQFRYNTTSNQLEFRDNTGFKSLSTDFTLATSQVFNGDGATTAFTLDTLSGADSYSNAGIFVTLNGVVQQPSVVYGVSGVTLTFTTAPATGDLIEVRKFTTTQTVVGLSDIDGDTQIQLEESSDEDIIRFDTAGSERMTIAANGDVDINANLNVDGNLTLGGNITIGDASSDSVVVNSEFNGDIIPNADGTHDLGSATKRYAELHVDDIITGPSGDVRFSDADASNFVALQAPDTVASNVTFKLPGADGTSGQALITDASGNLSFGAAGAVVTNDEATNAERLVYVGSITSGALTAATQDSGFTYNPSTGTLTAAAFSGSGASLTSLNGSNIASGTIAAARVATLNQNTTGSAATLTTPRTIGGVSFDGSANITLPGVNATGNQNTTGSAAKLTTTRAIALTGAVTGTANFDGSAGISIATTATADPTITLAGDLSGSATLTNLGNATLTATIAANSVALSTDTTGNYVAAGATSGSGISGSVSSEGGTFTVTSNATTSNSANTIVFRDGSGNFSANVISATTTSARYADLAEKYAADGDIEAGTVVHFAGAGKVAPCDTPNCRTVAGIVSTDPAYLMNSEADGVALALAGRVPTKVTGPVAAGDLMVSAGNGMAMANNDAKSGTIIGKAIEAHEGGEGVIEVLALMM